MQAVIDNFDIILTGITALGVLWMAYQQHRAGNLTPERLDNTAAESLDTLQRNRNLVTRLEGLDAQSALFGRLMDTLDLSLDALSRAYPESAFVAEASDFVDDVQQPGAQNTHRMTDPSEQTDDSEPPADDAPAVPDAPVVLGVDRDRVG